MGVLNSGGDYCSIKYIIIYYKILSDSRSVANLECNVSNSFLKIDFGLNNIQKHHGPPPIYFLGSQE